MASVDLTKRQERVFNFICAYLAAHGYPPSRADICKGLRFKSPNAAQEHLTTLEIKGVIEVVPHVARGIRIL